MVVSVVLVEDDRIVLILPATLPPIVLGTRYPVKNYPLPDPTRKSLPATRYPLPDGAVIVS